MRNLAFDIPGKHHVALTVLLLCFGCGQQTATKTNARSNPPATDPAQATDPTHIDKDSANSNSAGTNPNTTSKDTSQVAVAREKCVAPASIKAAPRSIADITALLNALPKPVTIPCLLDVLPRPFLVNASSSQLSIQPAVDEHSPRIFVFFDDLIVTFVPAGDGSKVVEFSEVIDNTTSVKGEIAFPVTAALAPTVAFDRVKGSSGASTRCAACHAGETKAPASFPDGAFVSKAVKPFKSSDVPLDNLAADAAACKDEADQRCAILHALFEGDVKPQAFPVEMKTLF